MDIVIGSDQERDRLFAELHVKGQPWAEVIFDETRGAYTLTVFLDRESDWLVLDLAETRRMLLKAKDELAQRGSPDLPV